MDALKELEQTLAQRRSGFAQLASELVSAVYPDKKTDPVLIDLAAKLIEDYVHDRALLEELRLVKHGIEDEVTSMGDSMVHGLMLYVVGRILDEAQAPLGRPQEADPQKARDCLARAFSMVFG